MSGSIASGGRHDHVFVATDQRRNERKVWIVIAVTAAMMVAEIVGGAIYGSMALTADGWHMATHAGALLISAMAYVIARRHARNPGFTFGTGKIGDLAGFASACVLAVVAIFIGFESALRFANPVAIGFNESIIVAVIGLVVNLACAWLLRDEDHGHAHAAHDHGHGHALEHDDDAHAHGHHGYSAAGGRDNNLRAAYTHVLTDALTSVLAIVALALGKMNGWTWADPLIGIVGAAVILRWSWRLLRDSGGVLVDYVPAETLLPRQIRAVVEDAGGVVNDLHVWRVAPGHHAAIVAVGSAEPHPDVRRRIAALPGLSHLTIEFEAIAA